jgi:hypothetical protein
VPGSRLYLSNFGLIYIVAFLIFRLLLQLP